MATIDNAVAIYGLNSAASPSYNNLSASGTLGITQQKNSLTDADIGYSFLITSDAAGNVASLNLGSGVVSQTTGSPTIKDGDGKDFDGETLATMVNLQGLLIVSSDVNSGVITVTDANNSLIDTQFSVNNEVYQRSIPSGVTITGNSVDFTFSTSSQTVSVIIFGKST